MSKLKKPTIEGLIEKLLEENQIQYNEAGNVQTLLEQASNGLDKDEIFTLVTKINDKLDAHTSDLITPNGLNYSVFESEVKTVTQAINKEKVQREKSQNEATTVETLQEKKDIEKTPQEKAEIERQERIAENKEYLKSLIDSIPGADKLGITDEELEKIAETEERNTRYYDRVQEIANDRNCSDDEARKIANQEMGIDEESLNTNESAVAEKAWLRKQFEEGQKSGMSQNEILEDIRKKNPIRMKAFELMKGGAELVKGIATGVFDAGAALSESIFDNLTEISINKENDLRKTVEAKEGTVRAAIYDKKINVKALKTHIDEFEEAKKKFVDKKNKSDRDIIDKEKYDKFFERITRMYLSSNSNGTISKLYEKYKDVNPWVKDLELEFEDFLNGVKTNLERQTIIIGDDRKYIDDMINAERIIRRAEILQNVLDEAKKNGTPIEDKEYLEDVDKEVDKAKMDAEKCKIKFATRRGIETGVELKIDKNYTKIFSPVHLESDIVRIANDRKQIIKISKELGISSDEAAHKYFSENKESLKLYTRRERKILTGKNGSGNVIVQPSNILKKMRSFMREKNNRLIESYSLEIELITQRITGEKIGSIELNLELKNLEKVKEKLRKAQERSEKLGKKIKSKTAMNVFEKKEKKNLENGIFERYLKSGKSAMEFLKELNLDKNQPSLSQEDILRIISERARQFMRPEEFASFITNEKLIFYNQEELEILNRKRAIAEKRGNDKLVKIYDKKIKDKEEGKKLFEEKTAEGRNKLINGMGLIPNNIERTEVTTQTLEEAQVPDSGETKCNSSGVKLVQDKEGQVEKIKTSLEVEQLEVTGVKPNVKAIAQKGKVTSKSIKGMFSKIKELYNSPKKSKQEEQEVDQEGNTTTTSFEEEIR